VSDVAAPRVLAADPQTYAEAVAVFEACAGPVDRYIKLAGCLAATVEVVTRHGDDVTAQHMLCRALAWIAAEADVSARKITETDRDFYGRDVDVQPRRTSRFVILPEDIDGFPVGRWA
jgi:hypothetical protein